MASELMGVRRYAAATASLALAGQMLVKFASSRPDWRDHVLQGALVGAPVMAAVFVVWSRRLALQLLARACWWSFLVMGLLGTLFAGARSGGAGAQGAFAVAGAGAALLAIGREGLAEDGSRFKPVAFRGTLQLSLMLAMGDTVALVLAVVAWILLGHNPGAAAETLSLAALTGLGVVGLLRLRTWGLLVAVASNLLVGILAVTKHLPLPDPLPVVFVATAAVQLIVPLPMIVRLVLRRGPPADRWQAFRTVGANVAILGLVALALYAGLVRVVPLLDLH